MQRTRWSPAFSETGMLHAGCFQLEWRWGDQVTHSNVAFGCQFRLKSIGLNGSGNTRAERLRRHSQKPIQIGIIVGYNALNNWAHPHSCSKNKSRKKRARARERLRTWKRAWSTANKYDGPDGDGNGVASINYDFSKCPHRFVESAFCSYLAIELKGNSQFILSSQCLLCARLCEWATACVYVLASTNRIRTFRLNPFQRRRRITPHLMHMLLTIRQHSHGGALLALSTGYWPYTQHSAHTNIIPAAMYSAAKQSFDASNFDAPGFRHGT